MVDTVAHVAARIAPIVLIIALGNLIRATALIKAETVEGLKKLVVYVALPAVLFIAFLDMELEPSYIGIFAVILAICLLLYVYGRGIARIASIRHEYFPYAVTGFEFGMVGITLFGTAYGLENVGYIAIVDVSHELFIWFGFVTMLVAKRDGVSSLGETVRGFMKSPVIIAIVAGLLLNILGLGEFVREFVATRALVETLDLLGGLLIPAILLIIGYGTKLSRAGIRHAAGVVVTRLAVLIPVAVLINTFVVERLLGLSEPFKAAIFTFLILPPPFIMPLFMRADQLAERTYINNVLSVYTVVSLVVFIVYFAFNPSLS